MNGFNIEQRKLEAKARITKYAEAVRRAADAYDAARGDLAALKQEEQEAKDIAAQAPHDYVLTLTEEQAKAAICLLGLDLTIPAALRMAGSRHADAAKAILASLQRPLIAQYDAHYGR